jgi:hypothetical protein
MTQFGISMNFLWIKQIIAITFILKIDFYSLFLDFFFYLLDWATISRESRG